MQVECCVCLPLPSYDRHEDAQKARDRLVEEVESKGFAIIREIGRPEGVRLYGANLPKAGLRPCDVTEAVVTQVRDGSVSIQNGGFCRLVNVVATVTAPRVIFTDADVMAMLRGYEARIITHGVKNFGLRMAVRGEVGTLLERPRNLTVEAVGKIRRLSTSLASETLRDAALLVCWAIGAHEAKVARSRAELYSACASSDGPHDPVL